MKFRKGEYEKIKKQKRETHSQRVELPLQFVNAGRFLSSAAFRVFCTLKWFNPSFPSFKQIQAMCGIRTECALNAIAELELKKMIRKNSGFAHRENNLYEICPTSEWDILQIPVSPSKKRKAKKERKEALARLLALITALRNNNADNRDSTIPIIGISTMPIIGKELDQTVTRLNNNRDDASRQRSPNGHISQQSDKGVGLMADDIRKPGLAELKEKWALEDRRKTGSKKGICNLQATRPL